MGKALSRNDGRTPMLALLLVAVLAAGALPALSQAQPAEDETVAVGRRIYWQGSLPSGKAVAGTVQDDVSFEGDQLTCLSCHRRSGLGGGEGSRVVPPISGPALYQPREAVHRSRPAYTDETLGAAIRTGIDAAGEKLDPVMPRYRLSDDDLAALISYLKTLSAEPSPGVTDERIYFGTVITEDVPPTWQKAMLGVLEAYVTQKNALTRNEWRRAESGAHFERNRDKAYREWVLEPWRLTGPAESWPAQLESLYRKQPVFALLSGISNGPWRPIHEFCERNQIPSLLPNTDMPPLDGDGGYSVYFNRGISLEARAITEHLSRQPHGERILQIFRADERGRFAAAALSEALAAKNGLSVADWPLDESHPLGADAVVERTKATTLVLWLGKDDVQRLGGLLDSALGDVKLYLSSTLIGGSLVSVPDAVRKRGHLAHPYFLPKDREQRGRSVQLWLKSRGIEALDERIQAQTYFACLLATDALMHIRRNFFREYLLDRIDHADPIASRAWIHPGMSLGPGQRYLSKGCYIIDLRGAELGSDWKPRATWIVP
jgi:mono/diheme cytochrome c family protein